MNSFSYSLEAGFLECPERRLFHVLMRPETSLVRGSVLFLHPFAEEMHMARRNVSAQARLLAAHGYNVMLLDMTGCGDSPGDFVDATWPIWKEDANLALDYLSGMGDVPVTIWGLRLGSLMACHVALERKDIAQLLLWQPVLNGEQQIDQFLRLRTAAGVIGNGVTFDRKSLWGELRQNRSLEIAGYELSPEMALGISQLRLMDCLPRCSVAWLEVSPGRDMALSLPSQNVTAHWQDQGVKVESRAVHGDPFWRNQDADIQVELQRVTREVLL
jgi:exosortase A-associated hydrolase 2